MNRMVAVACLVACSHLPSYAATSCRLVTGGGMAFGTYDPLAAAPNDSLMNLAVECERDGGAQNVTVTVRIGQGMNGTSVSARRMFNPSAAAYMAYGLYSNVGRSSVWGVTDGVDTVSATLSIPNKGAASATFIIYGRIPAQQDVPVGAYGDSVQITLSP